MLIYVPGILVILLLIILFRYLPHRVFVVFVVLLAVLCGIIFRIQTAERVPEPLTIEQRAAMTREQEIFTAWWGMYQKQIAELDRNWTRYHQILADAKTGETELAITYARLVDLERDTQELRARMEQNIPPTELSNHVYDPIAVIVSKTKICKIVQHLKDRRAFVADERINRTVLLLVLFVPAVQLKLTQRHDLIRNRYELRVGVFLTKRIQMVLLRMQLASRETDELFRKIYIVEVIAVGNHLKVRAGTAAQKIRIAALHIIDVKGLLDVLKVREQLLRRCGVKRGIAEGLQRRHTSLPFAHHVEDIIFLRNVNVERLAPHIEIRKVKM